MLAVYVLATARVGGLQVRLRCPNWRQFAALVAIFALALNVAVGTLCHSASSAVDAWGQPICTHNGEQGSGSQDQLPFGHADDDDLCCKCCCALSVTAAASPSLSLPLLIQWKRPLVFSSEL